MSFPFEPRDSDGRTYDQYVADRVMESIATSGKSVRRVAEESGIGRETLRDRVHHVRPFNTREIGRIAPTLNMHPDELTTGFAPATTR